MTPSMHSLALYGAVLGSLLWLGGCGKHESAPPAPASASTAPAAAASAPAGSATRPPAGAASAAAARAASVAPAIAPVTAPAPLSVAKLTLGSAVNADHQVIRASNSFATSDKILYASVATEGSSGGATLNAKWSYLEGQGQLVSSISQSIATDGPAITTFKVQNPDLWPEGRYKVEISLDGKPVAQQDFAIKKS
ncbi:MULTISPECIES: hypothetical protein [Rhodanobacter]|uniref:hypothetical protein n=1 Tax=Rhodanobacter TaxID=75309 RepID=UPI0004188C60|nr:MULTISPECIES: hypothetical protein [Rhodanobacter]KZC20077.1 hypothetical protein RHOFW104R3_27680 [Rhodanobacter denitrificans]UJJ50766.1 hypothetical protein LRK52_16225 [Rhodanobacter denitrificans]UJM93480.1 hypothetical protein LRK32_16125 [Rhodanobacter denitrificans]UJM97011.1 hypothetical protein LRK44_16135 [Rhodanobacter denitrificans]UJN20161.1 hypothetical protein LRK54_10505 [Rhodanobacter denitrificans]